MKIDLEKETKLALCLMQQEIDRFRKQPYNSKDEQIAELRRMTQEMERYKGNSVDYVKKHCIEDDVISYRVIELEDCVEKLIETLNQELGLNIHININR